MIFNSNVIKSEKKKEEKGNRITKKIELGQCWLIVEIMQLTHFILRRINPKHVEITNPPPPFL